MNVSTITEKERIAFTETLFILKNIEKEYEDKIKKDIINLLEENSIKYYMYYDNNLELKISELTKQILCFINFEYKEDENEKKELIKKYNEEEEKQKEKYDIKKVFEKRKEEIKNKEKTEEQTKIIPFKKNIWKDVWEKIKKFFKYN